MPSIPEFHHAMVRSLLLMTIVTISASIPTALWAQEAASTSTEVALNGGGVVFTASDTWKRVKPRVRIIDAEFKIPATGDDSAAGRLTVMKAMGSVDANIDRWIGQFSQPDGSSTKDVTEIDKKTIAGHTVHLVSIPGTFAEKTRGPLGPTADRDDYRMLAAIVEVESQGKFFIKLTGPKKTVDQAEPAFLKFVESLQVS